MGLKFSKEMVLAKDLIAPVASDTKQALSPVQERLIKKFGSNAFAFRYEFPVSSNDIVPFRLTDMSKEVFYSVFLTALGKTITN